MSNDDRTLLVQPHGGGLRRGANPGGRTPAKVILLRKRLRAGFEDAAKLILKTMRDENEDIMVRIACAKLAMEYAAPKPREPKAADEANAELIELRGTIAQSAATARRIVDILISFPEAHAAVVQAIQEEKADEQESTAVPPADHPGQG